MKKFAKGAALLFGAALTLVVAGCSNGAVTSGDEDMLLGQRVLAAQKTSVVGQPTVFLFGENTVTTALNTTGVNLAEYSYTFGSDGTNDDGNAVGTLVLTSLNKLVAPQKAKDAADSIVKLLGTKFGREITWADLKDSEDTILPMTLYTQSQYTKFLTDVAYALDLSYRDSTPASETDFDNQIASFKSANSASKAFETQTLKFDVTFSGDNIANLKLAEAGKWDNVALDYGKFVESDAEDAWETTLVTNGINLGDSADDDEDEDDTKKDEEEAGEVTITIASSPAASDDGSVTLKKGNVLILTATTDVPSGKKGDVTVAWYKAGEDEAVSSEEVYIISLTDENAADVAGTYYAVATNKVSDDNLTTKNSALNESGGLITIKTVVVPTKVEVSIDDATELGTKDEKTSVVLKVKVDDTENTTDYSYRWYKLDATSGVLEPVENETGSSITVTVPDANKTDTYVVEVYAKTDTNEVLIKSGAYTVAGQAVTP